MKKWKIVIISVIAAILVVAGAIGLYIYYMKMPTPITKDFKNIDLSSTHHVMFVAHPDDETIWGGSHIMNGDYLVVCITCGTKRERVLEFERIMELTNNQYIMLGYPDKTNGERDNWDSCREDIKKDMEEILALKEFDTVVTHNPKGEYGHIHHIMTSELVTNLAPHDKLLYFGKYYSKKAIKGHEDEMKKISDEAFDFKVNELIEVYKTQSFIKTTFDQMFPYENWLTYDEWNAGEK